MSKTTPQNTSGHPNAIGSGSLLATIQKRVDITTFGTDADALPCAYVSYAPIVHDGGVPAVTPTAGTITVAAAGGTGSSGLITLRVENKNAVGTANSDVSFTIDLGAAYSKWSAGAASARSLKEVIDLINMEDAGGTSGGLLTGFKAWIAEGGIYDMYLTGASYFQAQAETYVKLSGSPGTPTGLLLRDMAVFTQDSDFLLYWRLGLPEAQDRRRIKLLDLFGAIGTDTGCTVYVVGDDYHDYVAPTGTWATDFGNHKLFHQVVASSLPAGSGAANWVEHNPSFAPELEGPLVVIVKGDTDAAQTVNLVATLQACPTA